MAEHPSPATVADWLRTVAGVDELTAIRAEITKLMDRRMIVPLNAREHARYVDLCEREIELLRMPIHRLAG